ncbi:MAG: oxidase [Oscillochloris sp.]|nr:oxidase [Oscillochloris sp.]
MANSAENAHTANHDRESHYGHISVRTYWMVFLALMALMVATVGAYYLEKTLLPLPEVVAVGIAMLIAGAKTALIILFFMHIKVSSKLTQVFAASAFVWLLIMFVIIMGDYFARGWPPQKGPLTHTVPAPVAVAAQGVEGWRAF